MGRFLVQITKTNTNRLDEGFYSRHNGFDPSKTVSHQHADGHRGAALATPGLFAGILPGDYLEICAAARARNFARGETLCREGDPIQRVLLVTSGFVKITQLGGSGTEAILRLGAPGEVVDLGCLFSTGRHCTTAKAFRLCQALVWDAPTFNALARRYPVLYRNMIQILGEYVLELEERFREVATERVGSRVARQLVRLMTKIGRLEGGDVVVGLSRQELAEMTGTTLFTVSRLLSAWEGRGMVRPSREAVTICDVQSLRNVSD
jgi:CRP/FNR family transcriptional regulator, nitrogen oxide reductase regulator